MKKGKLYGVSVGPGDPELLTLKAKRIIEDCPVIAAPVTRNGNMFALDIVKGVLDLSQKNILPLKFLMTTDETVLAQSHKREARRVIALLAQGMDVAMLNLGDASIYSTFGYLHQIIRDKGFATEIVPGVTSFCAAAAALNTSLTAMKKPLYIIPSAYIGLQDHLELDGPKVIMKAGHALPEVKGMLREKGLVEKASLVVNCGLPTQKVYPNIEDAAGDEGYWAIILIKE